MRLASAPSGSAAKQIRNDVICDSLIPCPLSERKAMFLKGLPHLCRGSQGRMVENDVECRGVVEEMMPVAGCPCQAVEPPKMRGGRPKFVENNDNVVERIRRLLEVEQLSIPAFASALGEKPQRIKDILRRQSRVPHDLMVKIPETFMLNPEWWLYGRGAMHHADRGRMVEGYRSGSVTLGPEPGKRPPTRTHTHVDGRQIVVLPRYDIRVSAGGGSAVHSEQIVDYLSFSREWYDREIGIPPSQAALFEVHGNSMEPDLHDGDLALIDLSKNTFKSPAIYVILEGDELRVKKVTLLPDGGVEIRSSNESYGVVTLTSEQAEQVKVLGRARRAFPRMRRLP